MHKIHRKRVVKYIRTTRLYERYQVDLTEISVELNMKIKFSTNLYLLAIFLNLYELFW